MGIRTGKTATINVKYQINTGASQYRDIQAAKSEQQHLIALSSAKLKSLKQNTLNQWNQLNQLQELYQLMQHKAQLAMQEIHNMEQGKNWGKNSATDLISTKLSFIEANNSTKNNYISMIGAAYHLLNDIGTLKIDMFAENPAHEISLEENIATSASAVLNKICLYLNLAE